MIFDTIMYKISRFKITFVCKCFFVYLTWLFIDRKILQLFGAFFQDNFNIKINAKNLFLHVNILNCILMLN